MKLYAGTTGQFRADAQMHRIAEKLQAEYTIQIGHKPPPSEIHAWQNSLMALSMLVDQAELNDHGVILEYQLGNTSRRLDAMLTGHAATSAENAVVVELKQWSGESIGPSSADNLATSAPRRPRATGEPQRSRHRVLSQHTRSSRRLRPRRRRPGTAGSAAALGAPHQPRRPRQYPPVQIYSSAHPFGGCGSCP